MSQIRKLQNGGKPQQYGKLIIDSTVYDATPEMMSALGSYIGSLDVKHQRFLGDVEDSLRKGNNVTLNTHTNRISGIPYFSELTDAENARSARGRNTIEKFFGALTDSDVNQAHEAVHLLGKFKYAREASQNHPELLSINNAPSNFDYDTKDGKFIFSANPKNNYIKNRFQYYYDWLDEPDTWKTVYKWSNNPENEDILRG